MLWILPVIKKKNGLSLSDFHLVWEMSSLASSLMGSLSVPHHRELSTPRGNLNNLFMRKRKQNADDLLVFEGINHKQQFEDEK